MVTERIICINKELTSNIELLTFLMILGDWNYQVLELNEILCNKQAEAVLCWLGGSATSLAVSLY